MTTSDILLGPRAKVERAKHHFNDLCNSVAPVGQKSSDLFIRDSDPQTGSQFKARVPVEWSLIIGDCVHNLRSALDHLVCQTLVGGPDAQTSFPIFPGHDSLPPGWCGKIKNTSQKVRDVIYRINPCEGGNPALCLLHLLDIVDKHRTLAAVWASPEERVSLLKIAEGTLTELATGDLPAVIGPEEDVELFSTSDTTPDQYVEASVQINFGEGPAEGQAVVPTLLKLVHATDAVIDIFGREVF